MESISDFLMGLLLRQRQIIRYNLLPLAFTYKMYAYFTSIDIQMWKQYHFSRNIDTFHFQPSIGKLADSNDI